jgi:protein ImuB
MRRLDQALGTEEEPISPRTPMPALSVEQGFAEPILRDEDVLCVIDRLTQRLCATLEKQGQGARRIMASVFGVDGRVFRLEIGTSGPLRDGDKIHRLFTDKFANATWDSEFGFDRVRVSVLEAEPIAPAQKDLAAGEDNQQTVSHLIDRLSARLGESRVLKCFAQDTHVPEHACVAIPAAEAEEFALKPPTPSPPHKGEGKTYDTLAAVRPVKLFERPEPIEAIAEVPDGPPVRFKWRRMSHQLVRVEGPERIALPWWRDGKNHPLTRDYFRVETEAGARLWLYRDGLYHETLGPRWFLHGFLP